MDTTETYIKMCEKAEEIQPKWVDKGGGYWTNAEIYKVSSDKDRVTVGEGNSFIWLPRQDQLQEMVNYQYDARLLPSALAGEFYEFIFDDDELLCNKYIKQFTSMEQLWLAFVMKEKYNKTWNGKEWERL